MAHEKQYTAKQTANAVLEKVGELLKKHEHIGWGKLHGKLEREGYSKESSDKIAGAIKAKVHPAEKSEEIAKYETENSKKLGYKLSSEGKEEKQPEASDKAFEVKPGKEHTSDPRLASQQDPKDNPKEEAEGNNELSGTTPTQVGKDGKNKPGGDEIKGHLKLAKFVGRMHYKRTLKEDQDKVSAQEHVGNAQTESSDQHKESIKNK